MDIRSTKFSKTIALESFRQLSCDIDFFTYDNTAEASAGAKKFFFSKIFFSAQFRRIRVGNVSGVPKTAKVGDLAASKGPVIYVAPRKVR